MTTTDPLRSIHRITVDINAGDRQTLELTGPPISVAPDRGGRSDVFDLWYEHDPTTTETVTILIFGTGHPVPWGRYDRHAYRHLGTIVTPSGLVWHIYRGPNPGEAIPV